MNPAIPWLATFLLAPIVAVVIVQALTEGRVGGRITYGWAGLLAYFLAGNVLRWIVGETLWSLVVGLAAAFFVGLALRARLKKQRGADPNAADAR